MNFAPFQIGKYRFELETTDTPQPRRDRCQVLLGKAEEAHQQDQTSVAVQVNPRGQLPSMLFEVFDGRKMVGGLVLYAVRKISEDDTTIRVGVFCMSAFTDLPLADDLALRVEAVAYFLSHDLIGVGNKNLRVARAQFYYLAPKERKQADAHMAALIPALEARGTFNATTTPDPRKQDRHLITLTAA